MLVRVEFNGRRIRQNPRAAHRLILAGGKIADTDSQAIYDRWLEDQKPASTVPAPEKQVKPKRMRRSI